MPGCSSRSTPLLGKKLKRFRGGLLFKVHRLFDHSTLGSRVINKNKKKYDRGKGAERGHPRVVLDRHE